VKIAIVGGGIMGKLLAFSLVNLNFDITLIEKEHKTCSQIAAGLLTPFSELDKCDPLIYILGQLSLKRLPKIIEVLGADIYFRNNGSLLLAHSGDHYDLVRVMQIIQKKAPEKTFQKITSKEMHLLEPDITKFEEGYFFPEEGQIDSQALLYALQSYLSKRKVHFMAKEILDIKNLPFDFVCDCRGLGAKNIFQSIRGVRGELIWVSAPDVNIYHPIRIIHPRYSLYIVPRPNHIYILGASEIEAEDYSPISIRSTLELLTLAYSVHAGFSEARILHTFTHCRPTLPHHLPQIKYSERILAVNGLYRYGFLLAPTFADEIARFMSNGFSSLLFPDLWSKMHAN